MADEHLSNSPEIWKAILGFPGYEVSDQGRVKSYRKNQDPRYLNPFPPMILKPSIDKQGYYLYCLYKDGKPHYFKGHQLVLLTFIGPCPPGMEPCHEDGKPANNALTNLRWDTRPNNHADKLKHGTDGKGKKNNMAKLTEENVTEIRKLSSQGCSGRYLAKLFSVSTATISVIVNRLKWTHI